ncbi:MAG: hypothetical protein AAF566_06025 [Pseudomonadota bacterium]
MADLPVSAGVSERPGAAPGERGSSLVSPAWRGTERPRLTILGLAALRGKAA